MKFALFLCCSNAIMSLREVSEITTTPVVSPSHAYPTAITKTPEKILEEAIEDVSTPKTPGAPIDPNIERRVLIKCDVRILPILALLLAINFFDRTNIGNAKILGLEASLGMTGNQASSRSH